MKKIFPLLLVLIAISFTGCQLIGDIFGAGFYAGIFVVVAVIALIAFIIYKISRKN